MTASHKMTPIWQLAFILWFGITSNCQKFTPEQFPFPPQFKSPSPPHGVFGSDSSIYLPPESHTSMPYFSMNNGNKLPFQFLPPTVTKAPSVYPTPYPMVMSSTMMSRRDDKNRDDLVEDNSQRSQSRNAQITHPNLRIKNNETEKKFEHTQDKDMRSISKSFQDRSDIKPPSQFHSVPQNPQINQNTASQRRMIIASELLKNDQPYDQIKRASILGPQLHASPVTYYSTTEPAIPILRLSNEMDLDGSFSYEALGADQTHYVQNSRMENSGTDKEEQVVEGSYSYVGDNGQTYTVHYIADSNGYRASGDHLPVAPPIPEIIQRAVQYNLAEEAKRPSQLKSWQENEKDYDHIEPEKHRFSLPPPRNLFTGRTPEAFSFGLSQSSILQNNVAAADNSQDSVKSNFDFLLDQSKSKINNGPISPQITFLASQGAHNPSKNPSAQQVSRVFATEKPTLPQLMKYEAAASDTDQENNKALWRWQYGLNANGGNDNQHSNKNSISRSSGEGDDVIINFNNMSPEQYTKIIKSELLEQNTEESVDQSESKSKESNTGTEQSDNTYINTRKESNNIMSSNSNDNIDQQINVSTENIISYTDTSDWSKHMGILEHPSVTYNTYGVNQAPISTPNYKYSDLYDKYSNQYESHTQKINLVTEPTNLFIDNYFPKETLTVKNLEDNAEPLNRATSYSTNVSILNSNNTLKFTDFIQNEEKSNFKPMVNIEPVKEITKEATTEINPESIIRDNYFLKDLFKTDKTIKRKTEIIEEPMKLVQTNNNKINIEPKLDKEPKNIQYHSKSQNELYETPKKPLDVTDVLNYITLKNYFESNKLKSKNKFTNSDKLSQRLERPPSFIPLEIERNEGDEQLQEEETQNNLRAINNQRQQQLRGVIKNYKVLQRNGNTKNNGQSKDQFMTDSSRHLKLFQTQSLPPLGRAGPSMKSYLPPTYL